MIDKIDQAVCASVRRAAVTVAPVAADRSFLEKRLAAAVGIALETDLADNGVAEQVTRR